MTERLPTRLPDVTPRQREVARLVAVGYTNERIAAELGISHDGAKYHVSELLGRLGLQRREEIAAWYRAQEREALGSAGTRAWRRLRALVAAPAAVVGGAAAIVVAVAVVVLAFEGALGLGEGEGASATGGAGSGAPDSTPAQLVLVADFVHHHSGEEWESRAAADLGQRDLVFLLYQVERTTAIHAIDRATGERVGEIVTGGDSPIFAYAPGSGRLIVEDRLWQFSPSTGAATGARPRILVFDVAAGLALEAEFDQPRPAGGSGMHHFAGRGLLELGQFVLSADERYLYYRAHSTTPTPYYRAGIIDLLDGTSVSAALPCMDGGDSPSFSPTGDFAMVLACPTSGQIGVLEPDGSMHSAVEARGLAGSIAEIGVVSDEVPLVSAFETPRGVGILYLDGTYAVADASGVNVLGRALPEERPYVYRFWSGGVLVLDDVRLAIPYYDALPGPRTPAAGVAIFNTDTISVEHDIEVEHHGGYPLGGGEIALVSEARVDILDVATLAISQSFAVGHPDAPGVLPAVR